MLDRSAARRVQHERSRVGPTEIEQVVGRVGEHANPSLEQGPLDRGREPGPR